jgi:hypothetical protein
MAGGHEWEYKVVPLTDVVVKQSDREEGWELAAFSADKVILKRPLAEPIWDFEKKSVAEDTRW